MAVISKQFTTHKRGESDADIQDSVSVNAEKGRFALSDGVSQSFLPRLLADILTETYVNASAEDVFPPADLPGLFEERKEAYLSTLDEFGRTMQELAEETFKIAAATFVGLEISKQQISWKVIGDSCLFVIPDKGDLRCVCSEEVIVDSEGIVHAHFDNSPAQIHSDGNRYGNIVEGTANKEPGWYILMSDAISDWFINRHNSKEDVVSRLFSLNDNAHFENLVQEEWQAQRLKSDDCSVIIIRIDDDTDIVPTNDEPGPEYFNSSASQIENEPDAGYFNSSETLQEEPISEVQCAEQEEKVGRVEKMFHVICSKLFQNKDTNDSSKELHQCD